MSAAGARRGGAGAVVRAMAWAGATAWAGCRCNLASSPCLLPSPPDQDLVSEPPDEAQAAAAGAEDGAFLQPPSPLRTSERRRALAAHVRGAATTSAPARGCLWGLHLGGRAGTCPGPRRRLQSTACGLLGGTLLCRVQGSQSFLAGCLTL